MSSLCDENIGEKESKQEVFVEENQGGRMALM